MAAIVFNGLQPCYESQLPESRTNTTLRLRLPCSNPKTRCYSEEISRKTDTGGWSFLQALSNVRYGGSEKESVYVHPQAKRSSLILSEKSLQICTENLGNETGTDIVGNSIDLLCSSSEGGSAGDSPTREQTLLCSSSEGGSAGDSPTREQTWAVSPVYGGKKEKTQNFPPPLTTMRGSESLRVRPHREDGRLVIEAVRVPTSASCFKAERSHGRLRLHLLKNESTSFDYEDGDADEKAEVESGMKEEDARDGEREGFRGYDRPTRCREGECENHEMLILETFLVTT